MPTLLKSLFDIVSPTSTDQLCDQLNTQRSESPVAGRWTERRDFGRIPSYRNVRICGKGVGKDVFKKNHTHQRGVYECGQCKKKMITKKKKKERNIVIETKRKIQ